MRGSTAPATTLTAVYTIGTSHMGMKRPVRRRPTDIIEGRGNMSWPRMNPCDLGTFKAESRHQALLTERDGVNILAQRRARQAGGRTLVPDHDARARPDRPAIALLQVLQGAVIHEEQRVAELLSAGLQANRRRRDVVVAVRPAADLEHAITALAADDQAGLD